MITGSLHSIRAVNGDNCMPYDRRAAGIYQRSVQLLRKVPFSRTRILGQLKAREGRQMPNSTVILTESAFAA
ncbi:hypothetical protein M378DRAFT_167521 [Amanita muscaria Koide BX008]|uniref:Uncharacterized protein n=1 Tax=Amanita muscaria (strain Koide BX008) TaxID=946122 RepID=A0A0C2WHT1_AMAMK|nr:hypothetical protein M378DRAFT_167521 [Amanita muscaria Koide BX008]